jgi:hypothetical protein
VFFLECMLVVQSCIFQTWQESGIVFPKYVWRKSGAVFFLHKSDGRAELCFPNLNREQSCIFQIWWENRAVFFKYDERAELFFQMRWESEAAFFKPDGRAELDFRYLMGEQSSIDEFW